MQIQVVTKIRGKISGLDSSYAEEKNCYVYKDPIPVRMTANQEVPGSIPGYTPEIFLEV